MARGHGALAECAWEAARDAFLETAAAGEVPEALEGLGRAYYWLDDERGFDVLERAYRAYVHGDDRHGAARSALLLAFYYAEFRGEHAGRIRCPNQVPPTFRGSADAGPGASPRRAMV